MLWTYTSKAVIDSRTTARIAFGSPNSNIYLAFSSRSSGLSNSAGFNSAIPQLEKISPRPPEIKFQDLYYDIKDNIALPVLSYRLKSVSKFLFGNQFQDKIQIGLAAIDLYEKFLETGNYEYKERIIEYNKKDVIQTYEIACWYEDLCKEYK